MRRGDEVRSSTIESVEVVDRDRLAVRERYGAGWGAFDGVASYVVEFSGDHRRYRSIGSAYGKQTDFIKDGRMVATGVDSPWIEKCGGP